MLAKRGMGYREDFCASGKVLSTPRLPHPGVPPHAGHSRRCEDGDSEKPKKDDETFPLVRFLLIFPAEYGDTTVTVRKNVAVSRVDSATIGGHRGSFLIGG